jgi:acyl-CoA-binding protein
MEHIAFPDKFEYAVRFAERRLYPLEQCRELEDGQKLALYALRQQAEMGNCNAPAPYMWNVVERVKHQAWSQLAGMSKFEAMVHFANILGQVEPEWMAQQWALEQGGPEPTKGDTQRAETQAPDTSAAATSSGPSAAANSRAESRRASPPPVYDATSQDAIRRSKVAFDDMTLSSEVSHDNVQQLVREVLRLRQLLDAHGIPYAPPASSAVESGSAPERSASAAPTPSRPASAKPAQQPEESSSPTERVDRVYYSASPRLGWLAWLGLAQPPTDQPAMHV